MDITVVDLVKEYRSFRALDSITLNIPRGMFGLLGPNGAGKTTLMRILTGSDLPTRGTVTVGGVDISKEPEHVRKNLGYIPQDFGFYPGLDAYGVLDYIGTMKGIPAPERKRQIEWVLEEVNLVQAARRKVKGYSGGMKQRLGIAQALLGNPALLIVDEPTAGLDPEERIRFRNLLARLAGQRTVLLSTHIVGDVEATCSGLAVLRRGRLLFSGSPDALVNTARGKVWELEATASEYEALTARYRVSASRTYAGLMTLRVVSDENPLGRGKPLEPGLEDGFMAVMGMEYHA